jgi:hypothetical protein
MTEDRRQKTEDRRQKTEDRRQKTEDRRQNTKDKRQKTEIKGSGSEMKMLQNEANTHRVESTCCHQMETCSFTEAGGNACMRGQQLCIAVVHDSTAMTRLSTLCKCQPGDHMTTHNLHSTITSIQCTVTMGHAPLAKHLHRIRIIDSPICPACLQAEEMVQL